MLLILIFLNVLCYDFVSATECVDIGIVLLDTVCFPTTTTTTPKTTTTTTPKTTTLTTRTSDKTTSSILASTTSRKISSTVATTAASSSTSTSKPSLPTSSTMTTSTLSSSIRTTPITAVAPNVSATINKMASISTSTQQLNSETSSHTREPSSTMGRVNTEFDTSFETAQSSKTSVLPSQQMKSSTSTQIFSSSFETTNTVRAFSDPVATSSIETRSSMSSSSKPNSLDSTRSSTARSTKRASSEKPTNIPHSLSTRPVSENYTAQPLLSSTELRPSSQSVSSSPKAFTLKTSSESSTPSLQSTNTKITRTSSQYPILTQTSTRTSAQQSYASSSLSSSLTEFYTSESGVTTSAPRVSETMTPPSKHTSISFDSSESTKGTTLQVTEKINNITSSTHSSVRTEETDESHQDGANSSTMTMTYSESKASYTETLQMSDPSKTTASTSSKRVTSEGPAQRTSPTIGTTTTKQRQQFSTHTEKLVDSSPTTTSRKSSPQNIEVPATTAIPEVITTVPDHVIETTLKSSSSFSFSSSSSFTIPEQGKTSTSTMETDAKEQNQTSTDATKESSSEITSSTPELATDMPTSFAETTTEVPEKCRIPCDSDYFEGDTFCYAKVPTKNVRRYSFALAYCQQTQQADMADEFDFTSNFNLFQALDDNKESSFYFINEYSSKTMREDKTVRLIDLYDVTRFQVKVNKSIVIDTDVSYVKAFCRKPKYCKDPTCRLSLYYSELIDKLDLENNVTMSPGEERTITCKAPSTDEIPVFCGNRGQIVPHASLVQCTLPKDDASETELVLPDNQEIRSSCSDCFSGGTESCQEKEEGFVCSCKAGWTRFTCWKAPDLCHEKSCEHGECISLIDKFICVCYEGYGGERCEVLKNLPDSMFSSATSMALITSATTSISFLQKFIRFRVVTGDVGNDPQEVFIGFRAVSFTIGTMMMSFFSHPNTMEIDPAACRFYNWIIYFCFLLAQTMSMNEALNLCTTMKGVNRNEWEHDSKGRKKWWMSYKVRIGLPFIFSAVCVTLIFCKSWKKIPSSWTCTGVYSENRTSIWLPFSFLNVACVIGSLCFAECAVHIYNHSPMGLLNIYHFYDNQNPLRKNNIEKVVRNLPFVFINPIILFFFFLTFSLNADNENKYLNILYLLISILYNIVFCVQILLTTPEAYDFFLKCMMRVLPASCFPVHTPVTLLRPDEIKAIAATRKDKDPSPDQPSHPGYISKEKKHFIKRRLTYSYITHRLTKSLSPREAVENVISEEIHNRLIFNSLPGSKQMESIVKDWANSMIAKDFIKINLGKMNKKTNEKFHARALKILNEETTSTTNHLSQCQELKHLLDVLSYKPSQPGPFLKLPIRIGNRTEQIYFTPKTPPRTKHELRVVQEKFEKVVKKLNNEEEKRRNAAEANLEGKDSTNYEQDVFFDNTQPGFIGPHVQSDPRHMPGMKKYLEMETFERYCKEEWQRLEDHFDYFESIRINR